MTQRTHYSADFKARVALEALQGHHTVNELVGTYGVHRIKREDLQLICYE